MDFPRIVLIMVPEAGSSNQSCVELIAGLKAMANDCAPDLSLLAAPPSLEDTRIDTYLLCENA